MGTLLTDTSVIVVVTLWLTNVFWDTKITILYQLGKELLTHILSSAILWPPYWKMAAIEVRGHWFSYIRTLKLKPAGLTTKVTFNSWLDDEIWIFIYFCRPFWKMAVIGVRGQIKDICLKVDIVYYWKYML